MGNRTRIDFRRRMNETLTGTVLDTAAVLGYSRLEPYPQAMCWTLAEFGGSVVIPTAVLAAALAQITGRDRNVLAVLLEHPNTLVPELDRAAAERLASVLSDRRNRDRDPDELISAAHAVAEARGRNYAVLTERAELLTSVDPEVLFDTLP